MLVEMAALSSSPQCSLTVRPAVKRLAVTTDVKKLRDAIIKHMAADLAEVLGTELGRIEVVPAPEPNAPQGDEASSAMGLSVLAESGACDFKIVFGHPDTEHDTSPVDEMLSPIELLKQGASPKPNPSPRSAEALAYP